MKSDLEALMGEKKLDALIVLGNADHNPPMYYMTGGGHVNDALLVKKRGQEAILFHLDMERDEAAKTGLKTQPYSKYPEKELLEQAKHDTLLKDVMRLELIFNELGVTAGRVGVYGFTDLSAAFGLLSRLQKRMPALELIGESREESLFMRAMETKDELEIARIRKMGQVTTGVVGKVADYLTSCQVRDDEVLLQEDGSPLTIGQVKGMINLWLAERGAENPEGTIFAIGRDAGVPHSVGNPDDFVRLGRTIVFDIYPCEAGGGYFYDFTRTWSLGYATPEAQQLYDDVYESYHHVVENLDLNAPFKEYQKLVCDFFEARGHPTPQNTDAPVEGYVHSLGHGLGLNVHERPFSGAAATEKDRLAPGVVMTIEPGLYYPGQGMGVRLEDTYWVRPDGRMEMLAEYPQDFVLKMKHWKK
jgi:Xaa-Pro aminopeptidase